MLEPLGLPPSVEAAFRVAVRRPTWSVDELLAEVVRCGAARDAEGAATVLDRLVAVEALARGSSGDEAQLRVVPPAVALRARLARERDAVSARQRSLDAAAHALAALEDEYTSARESYVEERIERLAGLDAIRSRLQQLAASARREVLSFSPGGALGAEAIAATRPLDEETLSRGVAMREVHLHSALHDPSTMTYLRWLGGLGAELRTVPVLPMRMLVVDRRAVVIPADLEQPRSGALLVRSPGVLTALIALFESVWASARDVGAPRPAAGVAMSDTEQEVLRLLAAGATDEAVARQLGVSVRTVRRHTAGLMTRFQARSRFELGVRLTQQGWTVDGVT